MADRMTLPDLMAAHEAAGSPVARITPPDYSLSVSWPAQALQPHAKGHWRPKANATKAYRTEAYFSAKAAGIRNAFPKARLAFVFHPPDGRRRDLHNMPSQVKAVIDGIADAMGCDDREFSVHFPQRFAGQIKGGLVTVGIWRGPVASVEVKGVIS